LSSELPPALDALAAQASEQAAAVRRAVERVGELRVVAGSADGLVLVEVGAQGQLHRVRLDPGVYERVPPAELAEVITRLVHSAAADAADRAREIMGPVLPGGLPAGRDWWEWAPGAAGFTGGSGGPAW
jgi:DNA-binding protein YbaB